MYKIINKDKIKNTASGAVFHQIDTLPEYEEYKLWLAEGNTPAPEFSASEILVNAKTLKINELKTASSESLGVGFTCSNNIKIDADYSSVGFLKAVYDRAVRKSFSSLDITDFNNNENVGITLENTALMIDELDDNIANLRKIFIDKRILVMNAENVEAVKDV